MCAGWAGSDEAVISLYAKGLTTGDIAGHLAAAIDAEFGGPVFLSGTSTGGSVVLHLAVDRPGLVRGLVVVAWAYRLGPNGRQVQQDLARLTRAGDPAGGLAGLMTAMMPPRLQRPLHPLAE